MNMDRMLKVIGSDGGVLFERALSSGEQIEVVEGTPEGQLRGGYCEIWIRGATADGGDQVVSAPIQEESAARVS
jgi:hypothetical protein